jgi:hypothetical protein
MSRNERGGRGRPPDWTASTLFPLNPTDPADTDEFIPQLDEWWADGGAMRAIEDLAGRGVPFSADALRDDPWSLPDPPHPSQWGALFRQAAAAGLIVQVGYVASRHPSRHGGVQRLWRGADRRRP